MNIEFEASSDIFILRVSGDMRIWGRRDAEQLRLVQLLRAQESLPKRMILILAEVKQIDSLGVGALARVVVECGKQEINLNVVLPLGIPGKVLKMVHIFDAWPSFPDEAAAVHGA
jgi:anti-anti-sigma factor